MQNWRALAVVWAWTALGCGIDTAAPGAPTPAADDRARGCPPAQSVERIPQRLDATAPIATLTFDALAAAVASACGDCHQRPSANGGFSYTADQAGLAAVATRMVGVLQNQTMPPLDRRQAD